MVDRPLPTSASVLTLYRRPVVVMVTCFFVLYAGLVAGLAAAFEWDALSILTAVLVGVTAYYAAQAQLTVAEMRAARSDEARQRTEEREREARARCEAAARRILESFRDLKVGVAWQLTDDTTLLDRLRQALVDHAFEIEDDQDLLDRLTAAQRALWMFAHRKTDLKDEGLSLLRLHQLLKAVRWSLEGYLTHKPLRSWDELPEPLHAENWLIEGNG